MWSESLEQEMVWLSATVGSFALAETIMQRIGRVHRMGQRRSVQVLHFVARGAIEERVRQVLESKRALFEGLLVDDADTVVLDDPAGAGWIARAQLLLAEANGD